jgi:cytochrome P450 / NADPH-cytochrome P450 reductase
MANTIPIPGPPGLPLLGNIADFDPVNSTKSLSQLADTYGPYSSSLLAFSVWECHF